MLNCYVCGGCGIRQRERDEERRGGGEGGGEEEDSRRGEEEDSRRGVEVGGRRRGEVGEREERKCWGLLELTVCFEPPMRQQSLGKKTDTLT